jgi:hypothetical protein
VVQGEDEVKGARLREEAFAQLLVGLARLGSGARYVLSARCQYGLGIVGDQFQSSQSCQSSSIAYFVLRACVCISRACVRSSSAFSENMG